MADLFNTRNTENSKDEWLTPPYIYEGLGHFDLDVCEPINGPWKIGDHGFNKNDDGLKEEWFGRVWCNPPYGRETFKWLGKLANHEGGGIALVFARTDTAGFHRTIFQKATALFFFKGRLNFYHADGTIGGRPNAASVLVAYSEFDAKTIAQAGFEGALIKLK